MTLGSVQPHHKSLSKQPALKARLHHTILGTWLMVQTGTWASILPKKSPGQLAPFLSFGLWVHCFTRRCQNKEIQIHWRINWINIHLNSNWRNQEEHIPFVSDPENHWAFPMCGHEPNSWQCTCSEEAYNVNLSLPRENLQLARTKTHRNMERTWKLWKRVANEVGDRIHNTAVANVEIRPWAEF